MVTRVNFPKCICDPCPKPFSCSASPKTMSLGQFLKLSFLKKCMYFGFMYGDYNSGEARWSLGILTSFHRRFYNTARLRTTRPHDQIPTPLWGRRLSTYWLLSVTSSSLISWETLAKLPKCLSLSCLISNGDNNTNVTALF